MKSEILKLLKKGDGFVSGEEISSIFNVSRAAIWKHMGELKKEGYVIESIPKKGYRLVKSADILTSDEILPVLKTRYIGREIIYFDSIGSTNNIAAIGAQKGCAEGLVVIAEEQTSGRGRLKRKWCTPKFSSIAFSLVLRPDIKPQDASGITLVMGTAVCRALRNVTNLDVRIKWPNDIIINRKKVCGILTEMNSEMDAVNYIIAGVGLNINIKYFPEDLKNIATSLYIECGHEISRRSVLVGVFREFEALYDDFKNNGLKNIIDEFKSYSVTLGERVSVISVNEKFEGTAVDVTDDGLLVVELDDKTKRKVISGDVSIRGIGGYV